MPAPPSHSPEVVCAGVLVADHVSEPMAALPAAGQLVAVERMYLLTGGCAANVAINVAKQGIAVSALGCVGRDAFGDFIRRDLGERGVDCAHLAVSEAEQTSQTMILLCQGEDRRFVHTFGANRSLTPAAIQPDQWPGARVFYLGGYLVLPGMEAEATAAVFQRCQELGMRTMLDVVIPTDFGYAGELDPILPHVDLFVPNEDEAGMLTGHADPLAQIGALRAAGVGAVVVTRGAGGLVAVDGAEILEAPRYDAEEVDPSGAGDAFAAGFIAGMVRGGSLRECLAYGSALGASCVTAIGCHAGVYDAAGAERFLQANPLPVTRLS